MPSGNVRENFRPVRRSDRPASQPAVWTLDSSTVSRRSRFVGWTPVPVQDASPPTLSLSLSFGDYRRHCSVKSRRGGLDTVRSRLLSGPKKKRRRKKKLSITTYHVTYVCRVDSPLELPLARSRWTAEWLCCACDAEPCMYVHYTYVQKKIREMVIRGFLRKFSGRTNGRRGAGWDGHGWLVTHAAGGLCRYGA